MNLGDRVRNRATGEVGFVAASDGGDFEEIVLPSGHVLVHREELELVPGTPADALTSGHIGAAEPYALRLQALYLKHAYKYDTLTGLSNARIEPELHQIYVAHQVTQKLQPRMILADEVGLGKTIEAGLIIKELRARELVNRVLIVCPASLQYQWQQEMRSKFNEDFEVIDGAGVRFLGRGGTNPWSKRDNVICSLPFAANPKNADRIVEVDWDLVIFDEAHRVRRSRQSATKINSTQAYGLADGLKDLSNGLLLLTATPMQLHPFELYSLIELAEPGLFPNFSAYEMQGRQLPMLNVVMKALKAWKALSPPDHARIIDEHAGVLGQLGVTGDLRTVLGDDHSREDLMDALVLKHPLAGALVRNRKAEIGGFTKRRAFTVPVQLAEDELQLYADVTAYIRDGYNRARHSKNMAIGFVMVTYQKMLASSSNAIRKSFLRRAGKLRKQLADLEAKQSNLTSVRLEELRDAEEATVSLEELEGSLLDGNLLRWEIQQLEALIERLGRIRDSKAAELLTAIDTIFEEHPAEKVIIFTQFIETQEFLAHVLERNRYHVAVFNGQMSLDEKEEAVQRFRERGQILISTEAGGEGRNFQFCHLMINYDLPWNPMKIEQRIGRLDRIGQKRPVYIYNLVCEQTIETRILELLDLRIGLFEESVGSLDPILGQVERDIERLVMEHAEHFDDDFETYERELDQRVREARERERTLADFVLDRASFRKDKANELLQRSPLATWSDLEAFVERALAYSGGTLKEHAEGGQVISLSPKLAARLKAKGSVVRGTFDPERARQLEELEFFAFGHALVDRLVDHAVRTEGATTGVRHVPQDPPGTWVEIFYEIRGVGLRPSGRVIRHLVNQDLEVRSVELRSPPPLGEPSSATIPTWAEKALRESKLDFEKEYAAERERVRREDEDVKVEERVRAERIFKYREVRLQMLVDEQTQWIRDKETRGSDRDKKVLPARRGKLTKDKERLGRLFEEYRIQLEDIASRRAGAMAEILGAGVVVGG